MSFSDLIYIADKITEIDERLRKVVPRYPKNHNRDFLYVVDLYYDNIKAVQVYFDDMLRVVVEDLVFGNVYHPLDKELGLNIDDDMREYFDYDKDYYTSESEDYESTQEEEEESEEESEEKEESEDCVPFTGADQEILDQISFIEDFEEEDNL